MAIEQLPPTIVSAFPYKSFIINAILLITLFESYLKYRQYKRLSKPIPQELLDLGIDKSKIEKSKQYTKDKMKLSIINSIFDLTLELTFLIFNVTAMIWTYLQQKLNTQNEYFLATILLILETLQSTITSIPFSYYSSFVIEKQYNFNNMTISLFIKDTIKSTILNCVISSIITCLVILAISFGGEYFYIIVDILIVIICFVAMWIYPNFIAPLFNKFTELEEGELKQGINKLADSINYPLKKIFVVDNSKRSSHSNAYLYGFGKNKRIVLYDTLLKQLEKEEIYATLAHELGHWKYSHTISLMLISFAQYFVMFYFFKFFQHSESIFASFGYKDKSIFIGVNLYMEILTPLNYVLNIFLLRITRRFEYQADSFAKDKGYAECLGKGLKKLNEENLCNMDPDPMYSEFHYSHPTLLERLRALDLLNKKEQ
jgi:STE24 endopeptidase